MAIASRQTTPNERAAKFFATGAASVIVWAPLFGFQFIMLWMITLKEDEHFWTNAGGYSEEFRSFIQYSYYPLFTLDTILVLGGTVTAFMLFVKHPLSAIFAFCWLPIIWLMLAVIFYINVSDNIAEFLKNMG